jgi:hypothetical protein
VPPQWSNGSLGVGPGNGSQLIMMARRAGGAPAWMGRPPTHVNLWPSDMPACCGSPVSGLQCHNLKGLRKGLFSGAGLSSPSPLARRCSTRHRRLRRLSPPPPLLLPALATAAITTTSRRGSSRSRYRSGGSAAAAAAIAVAASGRDRREVSDSPAAVVGVIARQRGCVWHGACVCARGTRAHAWERAQGCMYRRE